MNIFDQLRYEITEKTVSWELDKAVMEWVESVKLLFSWIINWVEENLQQVLNELKSEIAEQKLIHDEKLIDSLIKNCNEFFEEMITFIEQLWDWDTELENGSLSEEKKKIYENLIDVRVENIFPILGSLFSEDVKNNPFYSKLKNVIKENITKFTNVIAQKREELWLKIPDIKIIED